jgi:hypothetical protein
MIMSIRRIGRGCFLWPPLHAWAMGRWIQLLDRAEGPMLVANPEREDIQLRGSAVVDALLALSIFELERPPAEHCHVRDGLARLLLRPCRTLRVEDVQRESARWRWHTPGSDSALGRSSIQSERYWQLRPTSVGDHAPDRAPDRDCVLDTSATTVVAGESGAPYEPLVSAPAAAAPRAATAPAHGAAAASAARSAGHAAPATARPAVLSTAHVAAAFAAAAPLAAEGEPR